LFQSSHPDSNAGNTKPKKSWGDRLKLGKSEKSREHPPPSVSTSPEKNNYLLQEYRNKYGTLSSGSALSKSMKYAETWLYGSVAIRSPPSGSSPRPSLFLYHHPSPPVAVIPTAQAVVIPTGTNYAVVACSCPEFLTGTARSKKTSSTACKKCGGCRTLWNVAKGGGTVRAATGGTGMPMGGTVRGVGGTLRLGGGSSGQNRVRPSLLNISPVPQSTQNHNTSPQTLKAVTPDPYDLMRRNRLGGVKNSEGSSQFSPLDTLRVRAKSTSPCRRSVRRSPSPPVTRCDLDRARSEKCRQADRRDLTWEGVCSNWNSVVQSPNNTKRKSILECNVNAYELIAKYLKNGNRSPGENVDNSSKKKECSSSNLVDAGYDDGDDDVLDDDLSDDLSDNALENSSAGISDTAECQSQKTRIQNPVASHSKVDVNCRIQDIKHVKTAAGQLPNRNTSTSTSSRTTRVTLGGQRIRIFNEPSPTPSLEEHNDNNMNIDMTTCSEFSRHNSITSGGPDNNELDTGTSRQQERFPRNAATSSSLIPRLTSPRRPPRKMKTSLDPSSGCSSNTVVVEEEKEEEENLNESVMTNNIETVRTSPSQVKDGRFSSPVEGVCVIKSILKKPSALSPGDTSTCLKTFGDTISKPDSAVPEPSVTCASSGQQHSPSPEVASSGSSDFYLPTFQEFKQQHRKKKQVQFKVSNDIAVLQPVEEERNLDLPVTTTTTTAPVRNSVANTAVITPDLSTAEGDKIDATGQSSVKLNNRLRGDEQETGTAEEGKRNKDVIYIKHEEKESESKTVKSTSSSDEIYQDTVVTCDKEKYENLVNDNVKICDTKHGRDTDSVESVKLQYFGEGDVDAVNNRNVSSGETASQSGADRVNDVGGVTSHSVKASAVFDGITDSTATKSGEYYHIYMCVCVCVRTCVYTVREYYRENLPNNSVSKMIRA